MNYGFPDWMFAAIAIAAYELAQWVKHKFAWDFAMYIAYGVIAVCAIILVIRYIIRFFRRRRQGEQEPEDWRDF